MGRAAVRRALVLAVAVLASAPWAAAQVATPSPRPLTGGPQDLPPAGMEEFYGPPQPEDLDQIAYNGTSYQKRHVIVKGRLDILEVGRYPRRWTRAGPGSCSSCST